MTPAQIWCGPRTNQGKTPQRREPGAQCLNRGQDRHPWSLSQSPDMDDDVASGRLTPFCSGAIRFGWLGPLALKGLLALGRVLWADRLRSRLALTDGSRSPTGAPSARWSPEVPGGLGTNERVYKAREPNQFALRGSEEEWLRPKVGARDLSDLVWKEFPAPPVVPQVGVLMPVVTQGSSGWGNGWNPRSGSVTTLFS